jgi:hypothetical protein
LVNRLGSDEVVIVEDEDESLGGGSEVVDQGGEEGFQRG